MDSTMEGQQQRLTIRIGDGTLSFSTLTVGGEQGGDVVFDPFTMRSGISMAANMREALKTMPQLSKTFQKVYVMTDAPVLMAPQELYNPDEAALIYFHAFPDEEGKAVLAYPMPLLNSVALFSMSKDLRQVIEEHFDGPRYAPVTAPVWQYLYQRSNVGARSKLFVYFHDNKVDVFCYGPGRFKFVNTFDTAMPHDAIYFILNVWKQLMLQPERDELHLSGDVPEREALLQELRRYIQRVYFINPAGDFNRAPVTQIKGMPYDLMTFFVRGR